MDYRINKTRKDYFWTACPYWIQDTFDISFIEAHLYNLILTRKYLCWTSAFIAKQFKLSDRTIRAMVKHLEEIGIIKKTLVLKGNKKKWILIALYNEYGLKSKEEIIQEQREGFTNLQKYSEQDNIKKMDKLFEEWLKDQL